jgi:hypothetical protein
MSPLQFHVCRQDKNQLALSASPAGEFGSGDDHVHASFSERGHHVGRRSNVGDDAIHLVNRDKSLSAAPLFAFVCFLYLSFVYIISFFLSDVKPFCKQVKRNLRPSMPWQQKSPRAKGIRL